MTKKKPSRVQQTRERLVGAIMLFGHSKDKAGYLDGYRVGKQTDSVKDRELFDRSVYALSAASEHHEACMKAIYAYARAIRSEERGK